MHIVLRLRQRVSYYFRHFPYTYILRDIIFPEQTRLLRLNFRAAEPPFTCFIAPLQLFTSHYFDGDLIPAFLHYKSNKLIENNVTVSLSP